MTPQSPKSASAEIPESEILVCLICGLWRRLAFGVQDLRSHRGWRCHDRWALLARGTVLKSIHCESWQFWTPQIWEILRTSALMSNWDAVTNELPSLQSRNWNEHCRPRRARLHFNVLPLIERTSWRYRETVSPVLPEESNRVRHGGIKPGQRAARGGCLRSRV